MLQEAKSQIEKSEHQKKALEKGGRNLTVKIGTTRNTTNLKKGMKKDLAKTPRSLVIPSGAEDRT